MLLTKENLSEWKAEVNKVMEQYGKFNNKWTKCLTDDDWLKDWEGYSPDEYVSEEISCWEE